jgi:HAD superfamily hydrolase (TIGR01509 family)
MIGRRRVQLLQRPDRMSRTRAPARTKSRRLHKVRNATTQRLPYRTVLCDVDGTLIDSNDAHAEAWTAALSEHGIEVRVGDVRRLIGMGGDKLLPAVADVEESSPLGEALARRKKELFKAALHSLQPTAGARLLLEYLRDHGLALVVATSADDREMRALLEQAGLEDLFSAHTTKDDAAESKPDPDIVLAALTRAGARPESTVMVGDTPYDIEAANRAGVAAIALRCGGFWTDAAFRGAIEIFDDPAALLAWWQRMEDHRDRTRTR